MIPTLSNDIQRNGTNKHEFINAPLEAKAFTSSSVFEEYLTPTNRTTKKTITSIDIVHKYYAANNGDKKQIPPTMHRTESENFNSSKGILINSFPSNFPNKTSLAPSQWIRRCESVKMNNTNNLESIPELERAMETLGLMANPNNLPIKILDHKTTKNEDLKKENAVNDFDENVTSGTSMLENAIKRATNLSLQTISFEPTENHVTNESKSGINEVNRSPAQVKTIPLNQSVDYGNHSHQGSMLTVQPNSAARELGTSPLFQRHVEKREEIQSHQAFLEELRNDFLLHGTDKEKRNFMKNEGPPTKPLLNTCTEFSERFVEELMSSLYEGEVMKMKSSPRSDDHDKTNLKQHALEQMNKKEIGKQLNKMSVKDKHMPSFATFSYDLGSVRFVAVQKDNQMKSTNNTDLMAKETVPEDIQPPPYLVQSTSYCHLARVIDITQEWRIQLPPQALECHCYFHQFYQVDDDLAKREVPQNILVNGPRRRNYSYQQSRNHDTGLSDDEEILNDTGKKSPLRSRICKLPPPLSRFLRKTQSAFQQSDLPGGSGEYNNLKNIAREIVQKGKKEPKTQQQHRNIARAAINSITSRLLAHLPISKAHAQAKEELLKTRLAEMILNYNEEDGKEFRYGEALVEPVNILRDRFRQIEEKYFIIESESADEAHSPMLKKKPLTKLLHSTASEKEVNSNASGIDSITALVARISQKLSKLDDICTRERLRSSTTPICFADITPNRSACSTPYEERKYVHDLLASINNEISVIYQYCGKHRKQKQNEFAPVLQLLSKVDKQLDSIFEAILTEDMNEPMKRRDKEVQTTGNDSFWERHIKQEEEKNNHLSIFTEPFNGHSFEDYSRKKRQPYKHIPMMETNIEMHFTNGRNQRKSKQSDMNLVEHSRLDGSLGNGTKSPSYQKGEIRMSPLLSYNNIEKEEGLDEFILVSPKFQNTSHHFETSINIPSNICLRMPCAIIRATISENVKSRIERTNEPQQKLPLPSQEKRYDNPQKQMGTEVQLMQQSDLTTKSCINNHLPITKNPRSSQSADNDISLLKPSVLKPQQQQKSYIFIQDNNNDDEDSSYSMTLTTESVPVLFLRDCSGSDENILTQSNDESQKVNKKQPIKNNQNIKQKCEEVEEVIRLKRRRKHALLSATIRPEYWASICATIHKGNMLEVDVEIMSDTGRDSVAMISEEFYEGKASIRVGRDEERKSNTVESQTSGSENNSGSSQLIANAHTNLAISINARSDRDSVNVSLEEVPWGEVGLSLQNVSEDNLPRSQSKGMLKAIKVVNGEDEVSMVPSRSLSRRSSLKSLLTIGASSVLEGNTNTIDADDTKTFVSVEDEIPGYVVRLGSSCSISCELNPCVSSGSEIEWFRGRFEQIPPIKGKFERISDLLLEVLLISNIEANDGQLYSISINGERYPVAYLLVEDSEKNDSLSINGGISNEMTHYVDTADKGVGTAETENHRKLSELTHKVEPILLPSAAQNSCKTDASLQTARFLSPPQTQFVMQGETAILSCRMDKPNLEIQWHKNGRPYTDNCDQSGDCMKRQRVTFEGTRKGWYRIIIRETNFSDAGVYHATYNRNSTSITLVVEERIDEREVHVSGAETDDEDLNDYLVPAGSTATISCELDSACSQLTLYWQKNHTDIDGTTNSAENRFEHVISGTKHYLIIHNAQPSDSGIYSVRIGGCLFKVAQITINEDGRLTSSRVKMISENSLNR